MDNFSDWLKEELKKRNWKQAELAHKSGLDSAVISNIINGKRRAGETTIPAIARALQLSPKFVFEKAGLLPTEKDLSPLKRQLLHIAEDLPDSDIELAIKVLEARADFYSKNPQAKPEK